MSRLARSARPSASVPIQAPRNGWHSPLTLVLLAATAAGGLAFAVTETRGRYPLIEPRYLREPGFAGATLSATLAYLAVTGFLFVNSLYLQQVRGMSALASGVALLPSSLALLAAGPLAGRLTGRYGPRPVLVAASACLITAIAVLTQLTTTSPLPLLVGAYLLIGAAWGLLNPPLTNTAISAMPRDQAGVASAAVGASRQLGAVLGVAVMGSVLASRTQALLPDQPARRPPSLAQPAASAGHLASHASRTAFTMATHLSYAIGLAAAVAILIVVVITMRPASAGRGGTPPAPRHRRVDGSASPGSGRQTPPGPGASAPK